MRRGMRCEGKGGRAQAYLALGGGLLRWALMDCGLWWTVVDFGLALVDGGLWWTVVHCG